MNPNYTGEELAVITKVLCSDALQMLISAEEWDLTESEEMILWDAIAKAQGKKR